MKIIRYAGVGATAATVDFLIFVVFAKLLSYNYLTVGAIGFIIATFSNDAANYVLFARKWSPFFVPSAAELTPCRCKPCHLGFPGLWPSLERLNPFG